MKKRIFISGKISGMEEEAYKLFESAEFHLKTSGFDIVNPMKLRHDHDKSWESYMTTCFEAIKTCTTLYMLTNWRDSRGAQLEHHMARNMGLEILYEGS